MIGNRLHVATMLKRNDGNSVLGSCVKRNLAMVTWTVIGGCMLSIPATVTASSEPRRGDTYAIIIGGIGKDPEDRAAREQVIGGLRSYLQEKAEVRSDRLAVLAFEASTAERVKQAIDAFAAAAHQADRFLFYYIGQANAVGGSLRLNLSGPDVTQDDLAKWLAGVKADRQCVVLDCPCAAVAAKALARPGRVTVLAAAEKEPYTPRFSLHFVPALARPESDTNHDGRISMLEAFTVAAREIEQWYQQMKLLPTETPSIEDNGDGRPGERSWRYEQDGGDGRLAAEFFLAQGM